MIKGSTFHIRHIHSDDLVHLPVLLNDLDLRGEYLPSALVSPTDLEKKFAADGVANDTFTRLLIIDSASGQMIGTIWHFRSVPYFNAREIGYTMLSPQHRGQGIATQAVRLLVQHLFESLLINRLEIRMDTRNAASERVAIKCGFTKEGVARGANFVRGKHVDMHVYAKLRGDL